MNYVEPIRDRKKIAQIKNVLRGQGRFRDLLLFVVGINSALRISDLLQLKVGHFLDEKEHIKSRFWIKEQKRGKRHEVAINHSIREVLTEYLKECPYVCTKSKSGRHIFISFHREYIEQVREYLSNRTLSKEHEKTGCLG